MPTALLLVIAFVATLPRVEATPLQDVWFRSGADFYGVDFTAALASGKDDVTQYPEVDGQRIYAEHCTNPTDTNTCRDLRMHIEWAAGPLLGVSRYNNGYGYGVLSYGPGTLRLLGGTTGAPTSTLLEVAIQSLVIDLYGESNTGYVGDVIATLGRGWLDPLLASVLGTGRQVLSGSWELGTDYVEIRELPTLRGWGGDNYGRGLQFTVTAPEPAPFALGLLALGAFHGTRRVRFVPPPER